MAPFDGLTHRVFRLIGRGSRGLAAALAIASIAALHTVSAARPIHVQEPAQPAPPTFRTATTLIQFTVVALDESGKPLPDLKKEDLQVFEDDREREIAFLQFERDALHATRVEALPAGVFTNRSEYAPGPPRSLTAIVLDAINTPPTQQAEVTQQVLRYLGGSAPESRIALYRLANRVEVLHDFSEDIESLRARIARNQIQIQPATVDRGNDVDGLAKDAVDEKRQVIAEIIESERRMVAPYNEGVQDRRLSMTLGGLEALGEHLAAIPGRKNLLWISAAPPAVAGQMDLLKIYARFIRQTAEKLATHGIAVYSVDANGLETIDLETTVDGPGAARGRRPSRVLIPKATAEGRLWASMDILSGVTGGRVVKHTNDPTTGIRLAATDFRGSYSLAFHTTAAPDDQWHKVTVRARRRGVTLLHREGYVAHAPVAAPRNWSTGEWRTAAATPLASMTVRLDARAELSAGELTVLLQLPTDDLQIQRDRGHAFADLELAIAEKNIAGVFRIRTEPASVPLDGLDANGRWQPILRFVKRWALDSRAILIRLIVRDRATGRSGVLDIPVRQIPQA